MQLKSNKLYPYPILWEEKDDYVNNAAFKSQIEVSTIGPHTHINIEIEIEDYLIKKYIVDGIMQIACHIECPKTKFRRVYNLNVGENEIIIKSNEINEKVEIINFIKNIRDIKKYTNKNFNGFYKDLSFDIPEQSIIAVSSNFDVFIEKESDNLNKVSSFVAIIQNHDNNKDIVIDCENKNKIYIKMPQKMYDQYFTISTNSIYNPYVFSMLIIPAIIEAFNFIIEQDDLELLEDYRWFRGLKKSVETITKTEFTLEFLKSTNNFSLAQKLLDYPIKDALDNMCNKGV